MPPRYRVGCMGWGYDDWKGAFYPENAAAGEYLERYARVFDFTEVDSSFYRPPTAFLTQRWVRSTPEGFTFSLKVPRDATHGHERAAAETAVTKFLSGVEPIRRAGKLGPFVAQFPPSFRSPSGEPTLRWLLEAVPSEYDLAVELRHGSWFTTATRELLDRRNASLVWTVLPGVRPPFWVTGRFLYARFVGDRALTKFDRIQRDDTEEMRTMRAHFDLEGSSTDDRFALVNNHFMGFGPGAANMLREVLDLPPVDLRRAGVEPGQRAMSDFT